MPVDNSRDKDDIMKMMQGFPPAANHQVLLANWREPDIARWSFNHLRQLLPTAPIGKQHLMIGSWRKALHHLHNVTFVTAVINWHDFEGSLFPEIAALDQ